MRYATAFGRFWWDFIVGDDWKIAAGVFTVLAVGAVLVAGTGLSDGTICLLVGGGVLGVATAAIIADALATARRE